MCHLVELGPIGAPDAQGRLSERGVGYDEVVEPRSDLTGQWLPDVAAP